jgi:hypothetical protein
MSVIEGLTFLRGRQSLTVSGVLNCASARTAVIAMTAAAAAYRAVGGRGACCNPQTPVREPVEAPPPVNPPHAREKWWRIARFPIVLRRNRRWYCARSDLSLRIT